MSTENTETKPKLTQEEKRIRIAEARGYLWQQFEGAPVAFLEHPDRPHKAYTGPRIAPTPWMANSVMLAEWGIPDYFNDLNAMHEAESTMTGLQRRKHGEILQDITHCYCVGYVPDYHRDLEALSRLASATATQHAEALGQTLNLWEAGQ